MTRTKKPTAARYLVRYSLLALLLGGTYLYTLTLPFSSDATLSSFEITRGSSVKQIARDLESAGLLRSPLYFRYLVRRHQLSLQAGLFQLSPSLSPQDLALTLTRGLAPDHKLTIPEGYRSEQIAQSAGLPLQEFLSAAEGLEGQLFPDTYFVKEGITASELVALLHANFTKKLGSLDQETLILASLVERETKGLAEKPIVAGILKRRLLAGWPLELDATIQYIAGKPGDWWPDTTLADRARSSPYNTYLHPGLPPAPIGNPGLDSIRAVQNAADSPYWFYLHDRAGTIHYASTLEEHNQNIAKYIK